MTKQPAMPHRTKARGLIGLFVPILLFSCSPLGADDRPSASPKIVPVDPTQAQSAPAQEAGAGERLHLLVGRSLVINTPARIKRISIADPNIADAITISPTQILLNGKTPGGVSLVVWNEADQSQTFDVYVDMDMLALSLKIKEVFPQEPVQVEATKDVIVLSGHISSKAVADRILQVVSAAAPKVISLMDFPTAPTTGEILLEVKFAEVNRAAISQFGVNFLAPGTGGGPRSTVGTTGTQQFGPPHLNSLTSSPALGTTTPVTTDFTLSDLLNVFVFRPDIDLAVTIKALKQNNMLQILAEPNLLTQTDKEASFLAGGEFPFPVVQGGTNFTAVTIQFKEFGVRLNFKPTLTETNKIHLKVKPEVSALDFANALTISGFLIPAISTRRVETEMELQDGQSFAIAGLVDNRLTEVTTKIPALGDIPILGQLFRSHSFNNSKTELLVTVTPHIVKPLNPDQVPPGPQFPKPFLPPAAPEGSKPAGKGSK